jgi:hypothetical protein
MHLGFPHRNGVKSLPRVLQDYMRHRFNLLPEYIEMLRCFEYQDIINDVQARTFIIFNPNMAEERGIEIKNRTDLEQHPEVLMFRGYIDCHGKVYVADRRGPVKRIAVAQ